MATTQPRGGQILDQSIKLDTPNQDVTGTLPVANGGTGNVTNTLNSLMVGNGTGALLALAPGTAGQVAVSNGSAWQSSSSGVVLTTPQIDYIKDTNGNFAVGITATSSAVNYILLTNAATGNGVVIRSSGSDTNVDIYLQPRGAGQLRHYVESGATATLTAEGVATDIDRNITSKGAGTVQANGVPVVTTTGTQTLTNKTLTSPSFGGTPVFTTGIPAANLPNGLTNGNTSRQSQVVVSGTSYYIAGSNLNLPATLKAGMAVGTRFRWRVAMDKTAAGTGAFAIEIRRGTAGTTSDTADVSQSIGTQTAVVDNMLVDVELVVTTTGATGAYYWSIVPTNKAITATGFGVATGTGAYFSGTVSSVAMNTGSLVFGLSFKATTGTPTITVPLVQASAINIC